MADIVVAVVTPIMEKIGEFIFAKVKRQFIYLCCFNSNIESLRKEAANLKNEMDDLQTRVDAANRNPDNTSSVVQAWITGSEKIQVNTNEIADEIKNVKSGCLAIKSRFLLSRKARKTADAIKVHRQNGKFEPEEIAVRGLPAAMAPIPRGPSDELDSRKQIEDAIMEDLRGGKVHMMGICGMGGVGKTTMATRIMNRVKEEKLFEEVVMVVISQKVQKFEIQQEIAEKFGLKLEEKILSARAHKLRVRLTDTKKKLLILDDIWEELDLESVGIPCKSDLGKGCTIVLTSRIREVLSDMNAKPFGVQILTEDEALSLFRRKIGTCTEPEEVVKKVVKECKGLPLALVTVGAALKDKNTEHWNDALRKLKSHNPNIPRVLKKVYEPIRLSYDFLENPDAKSLFLLCCLFPEDCDIDLEVLTIYCMGLRMFTADVITTLAETRDTMRVLVDTLKSCFLLLDGSDDQNDVKMHDVVRDVAIFIASEEGRIVCNLGSTASGREKSINCKWISAFGEEINKLPISSSFPSLGFLLMEADYSTEPGISTDPSIFQGMIELNVLNLGNIQFRSLPETTQLLKNLRTLRLEKCYSLETISIVGELLSLEILICRSCWMIEELPVEIGRLKELRMLEVNKCRQLTRIEPGVISNLVKLEELIIAESFDGWATKANGEQTKNAALCEIEMLENLTRLEIEIKDFTLTAEEICFPTKIEKFKLTIGGRTYWFDSGPYERTMRLTCKGDITFGKWIHVFLTSTEYLRVDGEGANNLDFAQAQKMKTLILENCSKVPSMNWSVCLLRLEILQIIDCKMMEQVFDEMDREECQKITFPKLKRLELVRLSSLTNFCKGSESIDFPLLEEISIRECYQLKSLASSNRDNGNLAEHDDSFHAFVNQKVIFGNLTEIDIWQCDGITILFSSSIAKNLVKLEKLKICKCKEMVNVIEDVLCEKPRILFPCLKEMRFVDLPKLQTFGKGRCEFEFPSLKSIEILKCPLLEFFSMESVIFGNLMNRYIEDCHGIRILFSSSTAANLVKLEILAIKNCKEMAKVIEDDRSTLYEKSHQLFPCLKNLYLENLPKLRSFGNGRCEFELPPLDSIEIKNCPLLEIFTMEFRIDHTPEVEDT